MGTANTGRYASVLSNEYRDRRIIEMPWETEDDEKDMHDSLVAGEFDALVLVSFASRGLFLAGGLGLLFVLKECTG